MKMDKSVKYLLIALGIIAGVVLIIVVIKYFLDQSGGTQPPGPTLDPGNNTNTSLVDSLGNFVNNFIGGFFGSACDKNNLGFQKNGVYNPDKCGRPANLACDPNRPGWNIAGLPDVSC